MLKVAKKPEERLIELMEIFHVSQADICNRANISRSTISRCLSGKRELTLDKAKLIAQAFDVNPAWILGFDVEIDQHRHKGVTLMKVTDSQHRLIEMLDYFHITQRDMAERTKLNKSVLSLYSNGKRLPRQDNLEIIADAYGVNPAWLMGYDAPMFLNVDYTMMETYLDTEQGELIHNIIIEIEQMPKNRLQHLLAYIKLLSEGDDSNAKS